MKQILFLAFLLLPFAVLAQSDTCPRVWRSGDSLLTDPAPQIQWLRDGVAIPDANERWLIPDEVGRYSVVVRGGLSPAFPYEAGLGYALAGYVFDELHRPVEAATVRRGSFSATTDERGRFVLSIAEAKPAEQTPVVVTVEKTGYWRNASRQYVSRFHTTETRIMLHTQRVTNRVDATNGGEMAYRGFTLQLPPHSVQTESGTPYSGTILLSVEGALPSEPDFGLRMPGGDFSAIDESGNDVMLYSYGYMSVEITAENGDKLELRPEARATLRFQLPYTETHRPDSVPLWHFNTETAIWEQEGWSVRNGSIYEGQVSHFSSWNCDVPADRGTCKGRVIDCNNEPVKGGWVRVGQRQVVTDIDGNYRTFVPGGITFDAWASVDTLREITVPAQEERTLDDLKGSDFGGVAVYNPVSRELKAYLSGNVPENLRLSIDGGQSWTAEREFTNVAGAPEEIRLDGGCADRLRVVMIGRQEDCRILDTLGLANVPRYQSLAAALAAEEPVYTLMILDGGFRNEWDLLLNYSCLQRLYLWNNQLSSVPESIGNLSNLQVLDLMFNKLTYFPESIGNLSRLQDLYLSNNSLISLPDSIGNLSSLLMLLLHGNELNSLPESIGNLGSLQLLELGNNQLTSLPDSIANLADTLLLLYLQGNPIPVERRAAIQALLPNTEIHWE